MRKDNTSGHIYIIKYSHGWIFQKRINKVLYRVRFTGKMDCICYKYIFLLKNKCKSL